MGISHMYILLSFAIAFVCSDPYLAAFPHYYAVGDPIDRSRRGQMRPSGKEVFYEQDNKLEPTFSRFDLFENPMIRQSRNQLHQLNRLLKKPVFNFANLFRRNL